MIVFNMNKGVRDYGII